MISFPNAKINLGLNIIEKRPDGYHNLESCFYPIGYSDILEIVPSDSLKFCTTGAPIPGREENNLCLQAYCLLQKAYDIPPIDIHLHKVIPTGAGLGGGSSDGAFALKMINDMFQLSLSIEKLEAYAGQLGSDCPFFIQNQPTYVTGTGNIFHEMATDISAKHLIVVKPNIHIPTAEAYARIKPHQCRSNIQHIIEHQPISTWAGDLSNDFEQVVFPNHPAIAEIKEMLYDRGALYAAMTGSGAAVFGIFEKEADIHSKNSIVWKGLL